MVDVPLNFDVLVVAAIAPILGVIAFWFFQLFFILIQKRILLNLYHRHDVFCRFTNYIGILFQTVCQALGYTVTRSGIATFQITINYGNVEPKKERKGIFEWIARSFLLFGPFFIPAGFVLLISYFIIGKGFVFPKPVQYTFIESLYGFGISLSTLAKEYVGFIVNIDLFNPLHIGYTSVLLFFGLGIRPNYIGKDRKEKIGILHDLIDIKDHLIEKPFYILMIILILYLFYVLSLFLNPVFYVGLFTLIGWMSLTAVISILITFPVLLLIKATDEIRFHWKIFPFITLPVSYVLIRLFFIYQPVKQVESVSLLVMLLSTILITIILIKYKRTNRFKTTTKMRHMRVADGKKRASKK